jgi:phosphohistidine phosphatase
MKNLYIIRHAKSDWKSGFKDFDRDLNDRGVLQSKELGQYLANKKIKPDLIVCSAAKRTILTSLNLAKELSYPIDKIQKELSIYEAHYEKYLSVIWGVNNELNSLFIVGHNPGVSDLVFTLTGEFLEYKTSCVAQISFEVNTWEEVLPDTGKLEQFITPSQF